MAYDIETNAKIFIPANDNRNGRYIVVMKPEHVVFPEGLRQSLPTTAAPKLPLPIVR